jgi:hypothetical protein
MLHARKIPGDGQLDSSAKLKGVQAFPQNRVKRLLLALKASLGRGTGAPLTFDEWGEMVGRPGNTLASWCADGEAHQIQALLASLERLPKPDRHRMVEDACRLYATLRHKRLAHDFVAMSELAALLRQATGFTAIQGVMDHLRTFLLTALGNSFEGAGPVAGIDAHRPDGFVPVVGVSYPDDPRDAAGHVRRAWPDVRSTEASLILLNGVWSVAPELRPEILDLARRAHVVAADLTVLSLDLTVLPTGSKAPLPVHLVTVSPARERPEWVRVEVRAP